MKNSGGEEIRRRSSADWVRQLPDEAPGVQREREERGRGRGLVLPEAQAALAMGLAALAMGLAALATALQVLVGVQASGEEQGRVSAEAAREEVEEQVDKIKQRQKS